MIFNKKRSYFENKLTDSIGKLKDIWNALKSLGFPNRISSCEVCALKINNAVDKKVLKILLSYYSFLPLISKVIEKGMHYQTSTFLNFKNLLYTYQSGFRKKHSTDFCLSYMMTGMILIDLQKAFHTVIMTYFCKNYTLLFSRNTL